MASIVPGYEYDIFISYRQKDNKHDGWVTEFVNNLKGELKSIISQTYRESNSFAWQHEFCAFNKQAKEAYLFAKKSIEYYKNSTLRTTNPQLSSITLINN